MVTIALSTKLWYHWLDIGTRNVVTAEAEQGADDLAPELQASLIAIASAAFCLDAIYAEVKRIHPDTTRRTSRAKSIAHTVLQGFNLKDADRRRLRANILWLFEARDMGVHHGEEARPTVPHPTRTSHVSRENALYCAPNARRAVLIVFDLLDSCVHAHDDSGEVWASPHLEATDGYRRRIV